MTYRVRSCYNTSVVQDEHTTRTCDEVALHRAKYIADLGVSTILELCVVPSLRTLETAYSRSNMSVTGNDIESRWASYYPQKGSLGTV